MTDFIQPSFNLSQLAPQRAFPLKAGSNDDGVTAFKNGLGLFKLPYKGTAILLSWGALMPLKLSFFGNLSKQRSAIKMATSTFAIPQFFLKQIKCYRACQKAKKNFTKRPELKHGLYDTKKIVTLFTKVMIAALKIPFVFVKTRIINIDRIPEYLPEMFEKTGTVLSLGVACVSSAESAWALGSLVHKQQRNLGSFDLRQFILEPKVAKVGTKFLSKTLKVSLTFASFASLFLGWSLSPALLLAASTAAFAAKLLTKLVLDGQCISHVSHEYPSTSLPA